MQPQRPVRVGLDTHPRQILHDHVRPVEPGTRPDPDDPQNVFYVARFVITCCAVDAQPVGVPVYQPGWQEQHPVDSWVQVAGRFAATPSAASAQPIAIVPTSVTSVDQPAEPYVY